MKFRAIGLYAIFSAALAGLTVNSIAMTASCKGQNKIYFCCEVGHDVPPSNYWLSSSCAGILKNSPKAIKGSGSCSAKTKLGSIPLANKQSDLRYSSAPVIEGRKLLAQCNSSYKNITFKFDNKDCCTRSLREDVKQGAKCTPPINKLKCIQKLCPIGGDGRKDCMKKFGF